VEADFNKLPDLIGQANRAPEYELDEPENNEEPKQLSLF
jgi:hypothetical protein